MCRERVLRCSIARAGRDKRLRSAPLHGEAAIDRPGLLRHVTAQVRCEKERQVRDFVRLACAMQRDLIERLLAFGRIPTGKATQAQRSVALNRSPRRIPRPQERRRTRRGNPLEGTCTRAHRR